MFIPLSIQLAYLRSWLWPPYVPPKRRRTTWQGLGNKPHKTFIRRGMTFLGRSMVMDLDPKIVALKSRFADNVVEFLEQEEHLGNICRKDKDNYYAYMAKLLPDLRNKMITKEQRKQEVEQVKAQRLNGNGHKSLSLFSLKDATS